MMLILTSLLFAGLFPVGSSQTFNFPSDIHKHLSKLTDLKDFPISISVGRASSSSASQSTGKKCPVDGHFLGHCAKCMYNAQCPKGHFCCPYMKKCVKSGHDPCYTPIANCSPVCRETSPGYPESCTTCNNQDFPNNWVSCPQERLVLQASLAKTTFSPVAECLPADVTVAATNVYPETEGEIVCSNAEDCVVNGVESVAGCAEIMHGKNCNRFYASECINDIVIDLCACAEGEGSVAREGYYLYEIGEQVKPSMESPQKVCEAYSCNVDRGCLIEEEFGLTCDTTAHGTSKDCELNDGTWCEVFMPTVECVDGESDNSNPCSPKACSGGLWIEAIIDCAEFMGVPCAAGWVPPQEGECCSSCPSSDLNILLTSLEYSEKEVAGKCKEEFGPEWHMAEWEDIKAEVTPGLLDSLDIPVSMNEKYYFVKNDGAEWYSGRRHYFVERHNEFDSSNNDPAPSNWLVHDEVGSNLLSLGSWYDITGKVLCMNNDNGSSGVNGEQYCESDDMISNEGACKSSSCCHWNDWELGEASFNGKGRCWSSIEQEICSDITTGESYCESDAMISNENGCKSSSCCIWNTLEEGDASFNGKGRCWSDIFSDVCTDIPVEKTLSPTTLPTFPPTPKAQKCPKGSSPVQYGGQTYGADIKGCGLSKCLDRFGHRAKSIKTCKQACKDHPDCHSFSYAPLNGDHWWVGKRVCTLYYEVTAKRLWKAVDGTFQQILCKLDAKEEIKCPTHTHQVRYHTQYSGADILGCGLQRCDERMGAQAETPQSCHQACRSNPECRSFTFAPVGGDKDYPGKQVCTLYESTIPDNLLLGVKGYYSQVMCIIKSRAKRYRRFTSCEHGAQLGIIDRTNNPEECAAAILNDPSLCPTGIFMHQKAYSYSWGCRCCVDDETMWGPHRYWSMYKVDMKMPPKLKITRSESALISQATDSNLACLLGVAFGGVLIGFVMAFCYRKMCRGKYGSIKLDSSRLNEEFVA